MNDPLTIAAADATRRIVDRMEGTHRLLLHGRVNPNQAGDVEAMDELKERWRVSAWKTYTQWGPDGKGFFLSDEVAPPRGETPSRASGSPTASDPSRISEPTVRKRGASSSTC